MKNIIAIGLLLLISTACSTSKRVAFSEMTKKPIVQIIDNSRIIVKTENSGVNSSLFISKIKYSIDTVKNEIDLIGYQSIWKLNDNNFEIKIKSRFKVQLDKYNYFWIDQDNKRTLMEKIK